MGQGLGAGATAGALAAVASSPMQPGLLNQLGIASCGGLCGLAWDFVGDMFAREGKCIIHRDVVLNATDILRHCFTFYASSDTTFLAKVVPQKHEWVVLESHSLKYYIVQKNPFTGDIMMDMRTSMRTANDLGLRVAGKPTMSGETRQMRADMDFDLPNDLQVAYVIAWLRKEDPRWAFSTENSKHFTTKLRFALNDF